VVFMKILCGCFEIKRIYQFRTYETNCGVEPSRMMPSKILRRGLQVKRIVGSNMIVDILPLPHRMISGSHS